MRVGMELSPLHGWIEDTAHLGNDGKFFFTAQVIADVVIVDKSFTLGSRILVFRRLMWNS